MDLLFIFFTSIVCIIVTTLCAVGLLLIVKKFNSGLTVKLQFGKHKSLKIHKDK